MLVSHVYQFIFLKNSKTAGTSTEVFFEQFCFPELEESHSRACTITPDAIVGSRMFGMQQAYYNHMPARRIMKCIGKERFARYTKIANIRNPFDAMVSSYYWNKIRIPFRDWVCNRLPIIAERDSWNSILFVNGEFIIDEIIRYETLADDIERVRQKLGLPEPTRPLNHYKKTSDARCGKHYSEYYDQETRQIVEDVFKEYLERFGYTF